MSNLYGIIGQSTPEHLLADPLNARPITIPVEPGNGTVPRGAVVYRKASGLWAPAATANITTGEMLSVLNEEIESGEAPTSGATAVAENAAAYQTGRFIDGKVLYLNGSAYEAVTAAHKTALAKQNIFFDQSVESAAEFENSATGK